MIRPLVFDQDLADLLPFDELEIQLTTYGLESFLTAQSTSSSSSCVHSIAAAAAANRSLRVLGDPMASAVVCSSSSALKRAATEGTIWYFCRCIGPESHTAPCCLAL